VHVALPCAPEGSALGVQNRLIYAPRRKCTPQGVHVAPTTLRSYLYRHNITSSSLATQHDLNGSAAWASLTGTTNRLRFALLGGQRSLSCTWL